MTAVSLASLSRLNLPHPRFDAARAPVDPSRANMTLGKFWPSSWAALVLVGKVRYIRATLSGSGLGGAPR